MEVVIVSTFLTRASRAAGGMPSNVFFIPAKMPVALRPPVLPPPILAEGGKPDAGDPPETAGTAFFACVAGPAAAVVFGLAGAVDLVAETEAGPPVALAAAAVCFPAAGFKMVSSFLKPARQPPCPQPHEHGEHHVALDLDQALHERLLAVQLAARKVHQRGVLDRDDNVGSTARRTQLHAAQTIL